MIHKVKGIVLRTQPYGDTSLIARIYTDLFGMQSYLLKGIKGRKSSAKSALFQIPNILEMEVYHKDGDRLQSLREARIFQGFNHIRSDIVKSSIALFMAELVYRSLREEECNAEAFGFLENTLLLLEAWDSPAANFHLAFMLKWTRVLGIYPNTGLSDGKVLNLEEGNFSYQSASQELNVLPPLTDIWRQLQENDLQHCSKLPLNAALRRQLLDHLQDYYSLHLPGFVRLKSPAVFSTLFS